MEWKKEQASKYKGFKLIKLREKSKAPISENTWKFFDHLSQYSEGRLNAGFPASWNGFLIIDVDTRHGGLELWEHFSLAHDLPDTAKVMTSEGGFHAYYLLPDGWMPNINKGFGDGAISIIHESKYVVAAGSTHPSGHLYEWEDLDAEFAEIPTNFCHWLWELKKPKPVKTTRRYERACYSQFRDAIDCLKILDPCMGYENWIRIGMAFHSSGYGEEAFDVWRDWSALCPEKFDENKMRTSWNNFGKCENPITLRTVEWMTRKA